MFLYFCVFTNLIVSVNLTAMEKSGANTLKDYTVSCTDSVLCSGLTLILLKQDLYQSNQDLIEKSASLPIGKYYSSIINI